MQVTGIIVAAILATIIVIAYAVWRHKHRETYLVYPYIDLDEIGERGSYYAMSECPGSK